MAFAKSEHVDASQGVFTDITGAQSTIDYNSSSPSKSDAETTVSYLPMYSHNDPFTGHDVHLKTLEEYFSPRDTPCPGRRFLVHGMRGVGKTQICSRFAVRVSNRFWRVFWVDATTVETLELSFRAIAMGPDAQADGVEPSPESARRWLLAVKHDWLIVFDNVDDEDAVAKHIPGNRGNILFTSRNPNLVRLVSAANCIEVNDMEEEDAISLLLESSRNDGKSISDRKTASQELLADPTFKGASSYGHAVYGTLDLSFTAIKQMGSREAESAIFILRTFAFFHHENISEEIFKRAAEATVERVRNLAPELFEVDRNGKWDPFLFREGIQVLLSYSLVKKSKMAGVFSLYPLVHCWCRDSMSDEERRTNSSAALTVLSSSIVGGTTSADLAYRRTLVPHIYAVKSGSELSYNEEVYERFAKVFGEAGHWKEAAELEVEVMAMRKKNLGEEHPSTLSIMSKLAWTYRNQGRWKDAEKLKVQVLEMQKRVLEEEHPDTLESMSNLASMYSDQGRFKDAEKLKVQVLETRKRVLGEEHPHTLASMNNLAITYKRQGRLKDAEKLEVQVVEMEKRVFGEEHPDTLATMGNLARTYLDQRRWKDAEKLFVEVLETQKRVLGEEHPHTLLSMGSLMWTYRSQGRLKDAEKLGVEALEMSKRVPGLEHPDTLVTMSILASTYSDQGRWKDAEKLGVQVVEMRKRVLGKEHPDTLAAMRILVWYRVSRGIGALSRTFKYLLNG